MSRFSASASKLYKAKFGILPEQAAGLISTRINRQTGTLVSVYDAVEAGLDDWGTWNVCEEHGSCVGHETRALAVAFAADPESWCEECCVAHGGGPS